MYEGLVGELEGVQSAVDRISWMLEQVEGAKYRLLQGEAPVRAAGARWIRQSDGQGDLGILFLTDQRLIFEQKEERTTEKFLFIVLKREVVHEFRFDAPMSAVEDVQAGGAGVGQGQEGGADTVEVRFDHTGPMPSARFHLTRDDARTWVELMGRVKSRDIDRERTERATSEAAALDERRSTLPAACPSCSAPIDQTVLRGMTEIVCRYCGRAIRL